MEQSKGSISQGRLRVRTVHGATAAGLRNPNSITNALGDFRAFLEKQDRRSIVVLHLGEVDCGILIWLKAERKDVPIEESLESSVAAYLSFVDEIIADGFLDVIITSATFPTINDTDQLGGVVNERRSKIKATQAERTELTFRFNKRLEQEAGRRGLAYVDVSEDVLDQSTRLVKTSLRNRNPADHHMDSGLASAIWASKLNACLSRLDPLDGSRIRLTAKQPSFIKCMPQLAAYLQPHLKLGVVPGDRLEATFHGKEGHTLLISEGQLNGQALENSFRYIFIPHWSIHEENPTTERTAALSIKNVYSLNPPT